MVRFVCTSSRSISRTSLSLSRGSKPGCAHRRRSGKATRGEAARGAAYSITGEKLTSAKENAAEALALGLYSGCPEEKEHKAGAEPRDRS